MPQGQPALSKAFWGGHSEELTDDKGVITNELEDSNISYAIKSDYIKKFLTENNIFPKEIMGWNYLFKTYFENFFKNKTSNIAQKHIPNVRYLECYKKN